MRMIIYALSAACSCAPAGYSYYQSYYPVSQPVIEYRSASEWGGETALPVGYSVPSPYYVGAPYQNYSPYPYYLDARHARTHTAKAVAAKRPSASTKVAKAAIPVPKPDPRKRIAAKLPPHTKITVD